ncbi:hypothetical protein DEU40_11927 [Chryseobacterium sp. AG844]|nr:hypothetical protein DEU40_11927 [Chryseobacterium sp. AG844]
MRKLIILPLIFLTFFSNAQLLEKTALGLSYRYTGRNVLQAGLESDWEIVMMVLLSLALLYFIPMLMIKINLFLR